MGQNIGCHRERTPFHCVTTDAPEPRGWWVGRVDAVTVAACDPTRCLEGNATGIPPEPGGLRWHGFGSHAEDFTGIRNLAGDGGGGDHDRAHEDRAAGGAALPAFEVAVR